MTFNIRMGMPEMAALWNDLSTRSQQGRLNAAEQRDFKKLTVQLGRSDVVMKQIMRRRHQPVKALQSPTP